MLKSWMILPLAGLATMLMLTGCPGGETTKNDGDGEGHTVYANRVKTDDVSDLSEAQPSILGAVEKLANSCRSTCALSQLVERDDFFSVAFDLLSQNVRVYSFRAGFGACAIKLSNINGTLAKADTYNKWDPNKMAEVGNLHFTVSKPNQTTEYCVPNGSVWEKIDCNTQWPDQIVKLKRLDKDTGEIIWVSTFKGWKGTVMAKKSQILHPMACQ